MGRFALHIKARGSGLLARNCLKKRRNPSNRDMAQNGTLGMTGFIVAGVRCESFWDPKSLSMGKVKSIR